MSAFMQTAEHIRVLVWAALAVRRHLGESELYWTAGEDVPLEADQRKGIRIVGWTGGPQRAVREVTRDSADYIGQLLVDENARSVCHRYAEDTMADNRFGFEFGRGPHDTGWTDREIMLALQGYRYQSCEHEGWADSEAQAFTHALETRLIGRWTRDVESRPWSIDETSESEITAGAARIRAARAQ